MRNSNPKVSVIMSVYNGEKYLEEAIKSILDQTFQDFEFLIVDDGSSDRTPLILDEYKRKDQRIRIIKNPENIGLTKSLNKAIKEAKGEYIARQDVDDISLPQRLEKQVYFMENNRKIALLGSAVGIIGEENDILRKKVQCPKNQLTKRLKKRNFFVHGSLMIRKNILERVGFYDEEMKMAQDYELSLRISKVAPIACINEICYLLRRHEKMLSHKKFFEQVYYTALAKKKYNRAKGIFGKVILLREFLYSFFIIYKIGLPFVWHSLSYAFNNCFYKRKSD